MLQLRDSRVRIYYAWKSLRSAAFLLFRRALPLVAETDWIFHCGDHTAALRRGWLELFAAPLSNLSRRVRSAGLFLLFYVQLSKSEVIKDS